MSSSWLDQAELDELARISESVERFAEPVMDQWTQEFTVRPLSGDRLAEWRRNKSNKWLAVSSIDGKTVWAIDDAPPLTGDAALEGVLYPQLHSRLVGWWLGHAWRLVELARAALNSLETQSAAPASTNARALLEEVAAIHTEGKALFGAWASGKAEAQHPNRPFLVEAPLREVLDAATFGTRLQVAPVALHKLSKHVNEHVRGLKKATGCSELTEWYDWLSDASHPGMGSRAAYAAALMAEPHGAVVVRYFSRSSSSMANSTSVQRLENEFVSRAARVVTAVVEPGLAMLQDSLALVDDFGLTTGSAELTRREYWRNFAPVRGNRQCPCGAGKLARCEHQWGKSAPEWVTPPITAAASRS